MLSTANLDLMLGGNLGVRPTLGWGKRFTLKNDILLDAMAQVGSEFIFSPTFDPRLQGGFQIAVAPTDTIRFFAESSVYMKDFAWERGEAFAFNTFTFGIKFFDQKNPRDSKYEVGTAAISPTITSTGVNTMVRSLVTSTGIFNNIHTTYSDQ